MQPPCEIMVSTFLPNMRALVSHELHARGESQRRIAVLLGITQARVSYYLKKKRSIFANDLTGKFGVSSPELDNYVRILSEDVRQSQVDGIFTIYSIWKNLLFSGVVCNTHQRISSISNECSICMDLHKPQREFESRSKESDDNLVLTDISEAISILENSAEFPSIMPEVSVNIAMSRTTPKSTKDVAAIPGRINRIHGRARAFVLPEFGSSNHMSNVMLIFHSKNPVARAVMNVKYDKIIDISLRNLSIPRIYAEEIKHRRDANVGRLDPVLERLAGVILPPGQRESGVFAIIDRGSEGFEPITYLFGERASQIAQIALKLAHAYSNYQDTLGVEKTDLE